MTDLNDVTPNEIWPGPAGCFHPPHVRDEILRVAENEITYDDVARSGLTFAPWYSKVYLAEQRVLKAPSQEKQPEPEIEPLRRRIE